MNIQLDWKVIDSYFSSKVNEKYISQHHINSFNTFVSNKLPYVIKTLNPYVIIKNDDNGVKEYEINVYIGGKDGDAITLDNPCIIDTTKNKKLILFPNNARLKDYSYASDLIVNILIEYITYNKDGTQQSIFTHTEKDFTIGTIPIMLHSNLCYLTNMKPQDMIHIGECPYDQGGYFIIDGKEKVIVSQERVATNKLFLQSPKETDSSQTIKTEYSHTGLIRCTSKENSLFPKTIKLMVFDKDTYEGSRFNAMCINVPNIDKDHIPIFILFRALGIESDKEIMRYIFLKDSDFDPRYLKFIRKSVHEGSIVTTQEEALDYLARYCKYKEVNFVKHVLKMDVFPNVGHLYKAKATYLGYLVNKMIRFSLNELSETNRDSYLYKRVDVSGILMTNVFRDGYNQFRNHVKNRIDREFIYGSWKNMEEFNMIVMNSKDTIFDKQIITSFIKRSFKGKWGMRESEGIVQDLNRLSFMGYISHIRRVNTPMDRSLKLVTPHRLDASQWGFMCPIESPDGENIGLLKHLSTSCHISEEIDDEDFITEILQNNNVTLVDKLYPTELFGLTKIILNNNWIGIHKDAEKLVSSLKKFKQTGVISAQTSVSWNIIEDEIEIFSDAGRCNRPVYIASEEMQKTVRSVISNEKINRSDCWENLISMKSSNSKRDKDELAPIEFIDCVEMSRSHIAMKREDIELYKPNKYNYIEIHPSLILSINTNIIPLSHHNQSIRNVFSNQQGKQALGVYATNFNHRIDTASYLLHYPQKAFLTTKYAKYAHVDKMPNGENIIVAIATYTGYNQEDSVIINQNSMARGMFNSSIYKAHVEFEEANEMNGEYIKFGNPLDFMKKGGDINIKHAKWDKIDSNGVPLVNRYITEDDVYVGKIKTTVTNAETDETSERIRGVEATDISDKLMSYADKSTVANFTDGGMIDTVVVYMKNDVKKLKIRFRKTREPVLGDKFASRHGQKGVVGMILPQEDMPFTRDGIVPDMIINPHAFPSRMTIAHLFESVLAKYCCVSGEMIDGTTFDNIDAKSYYDMLGKKGYHKYGDEILYNGYTGEQISTQIFFGPTYYTRLKHMVNEKMNYRGGADPAAAPITGTTRQPTHGRANKGGLRIGEMETNALLAHGIGSFIKESMMERSDKYKFAIDKDNGIIAIPHPYANKSPYDENVNNFTNVETPYTFKLLVQELAALGVKPSLLTDQQDEEKNDTSEDVIFYEEEEDSSELEAVEEKN